MLIWYLKKTILMLKCWLSSLSMFTSTCGDQLRNQTFRDGNLMKFRGCFAFSLVFSCDTRDQLDSSHETERDSLDVSFRTMCYILYWTETSKTVIHAHTRYAQCLTFLVPVLVCFLQHIFDISNIYIWYFYILCLYFRFLSDFSYVAWYCTLNLIVHVQWQ